MSPPSSSHSGWVSKMGSLLAAGGVVGLAILGSTIAPSAEAAITFGEAHDSPGSIIMGGLTSVVPKPPSMFDKFLVPGLLNLTNVGVHLNSSTRVIVSLNSSFANPLGMGLTVNNAGVQVMLDGMSLANITVPTVELPGAIGPLNLTATIDIADGATNPQLQASLNNLVTGFFGGVTPMGAPPKLVIDNISVSGVPVGLEPIVVPTQFAPTGPIPKTNVTGPNTGKPPVIGFSGLVNPNINWTIPTITKVTVKAQTGAHLLAGVAFTWENPMNVAIDLPYLSLDLGLNGTRIVTIGVEGVHLAPGLMTAETFVHLQFNNDAIASSQLGSLVTDFLSGTLNQVVNIGNITFGTPGEPATGIAPVLNTLVSGLGINLPLMNVSTVAIQQLVKGFIQPYLPIDISTLGQNTGSLMNYLKGLAISTAPGHTLLISPQIQLPLPFTLDLNIPYFALDINLDNNNLGQLFLANLVGSGTGQVDLSVGIGLVFREPSPEIPPLVARIVSGLFSGSGLDILAGVSNLAIGVSPSDAVNTLNNINIGVPISSVITGSLNTGNMIGSILSQTDVTIAPNAITVKVGTLAELIIHEAAIAVLPNNLVTAGIQLELFLGLPVVANIGYFGVQLNLDGSNLAHIDLTTGFNYDGGRAAMNAGLAISVGTGDDISTKVANLVNAVIAHQSVSSSIGIGGIVLGHNPSDVINALSGISVSMPLDGLLGGSGPSLPAGFLDRIIAQLGLQVSGLSLSTIPNAGLEIGAKASFSNPIPISLSVPFIGIAGGLDSVDIVDVGLEHLSLQPGPNALQAEVGLHFNNADSAQSKVATFVGELVGGQLGNTPEAITLHNLRIGASPSDYFDLFSKIDISIPSKDIINKPNIDYIMSKAGLSLDGAANNLLNNLKIGAISADLNKAPVIELGTSISVSNFSLNAAVNIGYFGIDLALDSHSLARVDVPSITISTANNQLTLAVKASVTIQDTPEIQTDIANLFNYFMSNTTTAPVNSLVISRPLLGVSTSDNIRTFSLIQYPLALPELLAKARAYLNQVLAGAGGFNMNNIALSGLVVDLNNPSIIAIQGALQVKNLTLPADISINYVGVSLGLDSTPFADLTIPSLSLTSANNALSVSFQANLDVKQGQALNTQIVKLVGAVLYPGQVAPPTNVVIYEPVFGADKNRLFRILSQIKFNIPIAPYLKKIGDLLNGALNGGAGSNLLAGLDIGSLVVDLNSPQTIGIDAAITLKNVSIPAEIKLNYVGVNLAIDTIALANIAVPSFKLEPANGGLSISAHVDVNLMTSQQLTTAISNLIAGVINNQTTPATNLVISGAVFGGSPTKVFTILQSIAIPINIAPYINKIPQLIGGAGSIANRISFGAFVIDLNSPQTIGVDTSISIKNVTLPAQIKLNYVGADVAIGEIPLVKLGVPQFTMQPNNGNLDIALRLNLELQDSPALSATVNGLVQAVLAGQPVPSTKLVVSGAVFGGSPSNVFSILKDVKIPLDVTAYINQAIAAIGSGNGASLLNRIGINDLVVDLNSPQVIGIDASIAIRNISLPAEIKLNYVGVNLAIDTVALAQVSIPSFKLQPSGDGLLITAHVDINLMTSEQLTTAISNLIAGVLGNQTTPATNLVISGAVFGGSPTSVFTILQRVIIPINIAPYINKIPQLIGGAGSIANRVSFGAFVIDLNSPQIIGVDTSISIKNVTLPAQIKLNYVGADIAIGQVPLVKLGVPQFTMQPNNGNLDIALRLELALQDSPALTATINGLVQTVLAGQPVPSTKLVVSGAVFGGSSSNVFTILKDVKIPLDVTAYINQAIGAIGSGNGASLFSRIGISDLVVDLNSPQVIGIDASVLVKNISLPAEIKLNYVGANIGINAVPLAQVAIPTFSLAPQNGDLALKVHVAISLLSSDELSKTISALVGALLESKPLPRTDLVISGAVFGGSPTKVFTILQGVIIPIDISALLAKLGGTIGGSGSLLNSIGLSGLAINLNQAPVIGIDANIAVRNLTLPAKLNVGYFGLDIGINNIPLVEVSLPKIELGQNGGDLIIGTHIDANLKETDASQSLVAALVNAVVAGQTPQGTIVISNIAFGPSKGNVYNILKGIQIPIPISKILSVVPTVPGGNGTSILDKIALDSADINMKNPPSIGADIAVALLGYQFDAKLLLNYVSISAFLDSTPLATISVPGIDLSSGNNQIALKVRSLVNLASGGDIQSKIAAIAAQIMGNGGGQDVNLVVSNIAFGGSSGSVFHILDKVRVSVPLAPYIQKLAGIVGGIIGGTPTPGGPAFAINNLEINAPSASDLSIGVAASISGIGSKISVEMPYVGLVVTAGGAPFVLPTINNFQLSNGNIALTLALPFQPAASQIIGSLSTPVSQLLFTSVGNVPGSVVVNSIRFGASPSQAFDIAAKIGLEIQLNSVFQKAQAYINANNPLHVTDMNTVLTTTGIDATISVPGIPLSVPLKMNFPITLSAYYKGGSPFIGIAATSMSLGQRPWALGATINTIQPAFKTALDGILPNALQWKNALQDVTLGGVTLGKFTVLGALRITPPEVTLWSPISVPLDQLKLHLSPLGMDFVATFVNRGPLQVDMGSINVMVKQDKIDVVEVQNLGGPIHLNNGNQNGGNNALQMNASLKFSFLEFFKILPGLLNPGDNFQFVFNMKTSSGQPMPWLQDALNGVPASIFKNLLPILAKALGNIKFPIL